MFIPAFPTAIPTRKIDVHEELLNPLEELTFDILVIVQVVVGSLMFICLAHNLVILLSHHK